MEMVSGYDALLPGTQKITVIYKGRTLSFDVIVKDKYYIPIYTIEELYSVRNNLSGSYILMNDIDLSEATAVGGDWDFMGNGWNPIGSGDIYGNGAFSGEFDGNGHKITGMRIDVTTLPAGVGTNVYIGLFAKFEYLIISYISLNNLKVIPYAHIKYIWVLTYYSDVSSNCVFI